MSIVETVVGNCERAEMDEALGKEEGGGILEW